MVRSFSNELRVVHRVTEMKALRKKLPEPVGFVPTMGALHEGHLALVRKARLENESVIVSIFVNPTQFSPQEDFAAYPRDFQRDLKLLGAEGVDAVFAPEAGEMYPPGFSTWVKVEKLTQRLEGASRPGHFRGVATVVAKLFNITLPTRAYFGQKDAQQALVIKRMVTDLNFDLELVVVPTVREPDGLAMSSRNIYLSPEERQSATILWKALSEAEKLWRGGEQDAEKLRRQIRELIQTEPKAKLEYVSVADAESLEELSRIDRPALVSLAARIGQARLIDNITLG